MELILKKLADIKPYPNNPRLNNDAVNAVMESIKQCTYIAPIVVDDDNVILAGHTRYKAMKKLGWKECEVIVKEGLTEEQKQKYRLLDNKTNELADWDFDMLAVELEGLDFGDLDLDWGFTDQEEENEQDGEDEKYNSSTNIPQYEPSQDVKDVNQCDTQQNSGGLTGIYLEDGTYIKSFYSVICQPSCVKISKIGCTHNRYHHNVDWKYCCPEIISEKWRKPG